VSESVWFGLNQGEKLLGSTVVVKISPSQGQEKGYFL
jgi:hypothetical protein